jgi:hypothetical protein
MHEPALFVNVLAPVGEQHHNQGVVDEEKDN